jgi:hypothetical protein
MGGMEHKSVETRSNKKLWNARAAEVSTVD